MIYTFWSVNGGVGKTTLSSSLAYSLAKRDQNKKVILLDFNLVNPDIDLHLNIKPNDLKDIYNDIVNKNLGFDTINNYIIEHPKYENFHIFCGLYDLNFFDKFNLESFTEILVLVKAMGYDYIIIDIDSALNIDATFSALFNADKVMIVADGMFHSLRNLNRYLENALSKININDNNTSIIINKYDQNAMASKQEVKHILGRKDITFIDHSFRVQECINIGIPIIDDKSNQSLKVREQIKEWVENLIGGEN